MVGKLVCGGPGSKVGLSLGGEGIAVGEVLGNISGSRLLSKLLGFIEGNSLGEGVEKPDGT